MVPPPELPLNVTIDGFKPNEDKEENMDLPQALPLDDRKPNDDKEEDVVAMDVDEEQALNGFDDFDTDRYLLDRSFWLALSDVFKSMIRQPLENQ